ncbi:DNA-binding helix-turn-helix protein [Oribacterium sinus F0268]|uniref:DNA-binding helix-turn-helix protein n=2 Tax=Oribacterium sinus TaxID=237576 RepID=C2KWJ8_9FIRM|nr:DNA-binding helix-turn-helix protein [Oribacterium sinus F0268]
MKIGGITMEDMKNKVQKIFTRNLNNLLQEHNKTQLELANYIGVSNTSVNNWTKGYNTPRMDKIDLICSFFHIRREDLLTDTPQEQTYYTNPETVKVAQEIFDNSDLRVLFDAAKDSSPEQLKLAAEMLRQFKKTAGEDND